jgi:hypothetical protein
MRCSSGIAQTHLFVSNFGGLPRPLKPTTHQESALRPGPFAIDPENSPKKLPAVLPIITFKRRTIISASTSRS